MLVSSFHFNLIYQVSVLLNGNRTITSSICNLHQKFHFQFSKLYRWKKDRLKIFLTNFHIFHIFHAYQKHLYIQIYIYKLNKNIKIFKDENFKATNIQPHRFPRQTLYFSLKKKNEMRAEYKMLCRTFSRRGNRIDRGNRVSSRLLDPPSHNNLTQAWRVKPWPGIQACYVEALFQNFKRSSLIYRTWRTFTDARSKANQLSIPWHVFQRRDRWNKGIIKTNFWYSW